MTFDLKADRDLCEQCAYDDSVGADVLLPRLVAALDEIERLQAREKEFSNMATHISATLKAFVLGSSKRTHFALDVADHWIEQYECQAKRIADLENQSAQWIEAYHGLVAEWNRRHPTDSMELEGPV